MKIATLGAGMVGRTIAIDLASKYDVTAFDISADNLRILKEKHGIKTCQFDLKQYALYEEALQTFDLVACAVPGFMGFNALQSVIKAGKNVVDISFSPENLLLLDGLAKEKKVTAIVDCGVAPGLSNFALGYANAQMDIKSFECMVGGLPKNPKPPFNYKAPFSPIDVIEEYTRPARLMKNGQIITLPALTDLKTEHFDETGALESFNTDGLRSILETMKHIPNMVEKTLRYPGHVQLIQNMMQDGLFREEHIDVTTNMLFKEWKLEPGEPEFTVMKIVIDGIKNNIPTSTEYFLFDTYDAATNISSMSRTTAYTCTAGVHMIANGLVKNHGVFPPELIGGDSACFQFLLGHLADHGISFKSMEKLG